MTTTKKSTTKKADAIPAHTGNLNVLSLAKEIEARDAAKAKKAAPLSKAEAAAIRAAAKRSEKPAKKAAKPAADTLKIRLYAKGEFYFGKLAAARINGLPCIAVEAKGKTITLTPTKSAKDSMKVMFCHANPVLRVAKLLAETGWSKQTQDLVAKPVGENAMAVEIR